MNHIDLQKILFLDIETLSGEPNFEVLFGDMHTEIINKGNWLVEDKINSSSCTFPFPI